MDIKQVKNQRSVIITIYVWTKQIMCHSEEHMEFPIHHHHYNDCKMQPTSDAGNSLRVEVDEVEAEADNSPPCYSSKVRGQTMCHALSSDGEHLYGIYLQYLTNSFCKQCASNSYNLVYIVNYIFKVFLLLSVCFYCI
jgi:hypothetical protein